MSRLATELLELVNEIISVPVNVVGWRVCLRIVQHRHELKCSFVQLNSFVLLET